MIDFLNIISFYVKTKKFEIMKIWANLAVANLQRTNDFYQQLGFKSNNPYLVFNLY